MKRRQPMLKRQPIIGTIGVMDGVYAIPRPFHRSLRLMEQYSHEALCQSGQTIWLTDTDYSLHDRARNDLVSKMRGDWLLMLDIDMAFDPDLCARLVQVMYAHDLDVVTGMYSYKQPPHFPVVYSELSPTPITHWDRECAIFPVKSAGGGNLLIRRRLLDRIRTELNCLPFERTRSDGEDFSFFKRCDALKVTPYCAWRVQPAHITHLA